MKKIKCSYKLTESNVSTLLFTLDLMLNIYFDNVDYEVEGYYIDCAENAIHMLKNNVKKIPFEEFEVMVISICLAKQIINNSHTYEFIDEETYDFASHTFDINSLYDQFKPYFEYIDFELLKS